MIDKLELLLALAKERHFGRAAEACGVTQPTMSTSLKQLEEILGVMLVQRGSRFQGFTPEGERTLDWARRIVGDARAMRQEINSLKDKLSGEIRIAAIPTVLGMVASLTTPFRARHPDVRFRVVSCTSAEVLGLLRRAYLVEFVYADKYTIASTMHVSRHSGSEAAEFGHDFWIAQRLLSPCDATR